MPREITGDKLTRFIIANKVKFDVSGDKSGVLLRAEYKDGDTQHGYEIQLHDDIGERFKECVTHLFIHDENRADD